MSPLVDPRLRQVLEARYHERANIGSQGAPSYSPTGEQRPGGLQVLVADVPCAIAVQNTAGSGELDTGGQGARPHGAASNSIASYRFAFARDVAISTASVLQVLAGPNAGLYDVDRVFGDGAGLQVLAEATKVL